MKPTHYIHISESNVSVKDAEFFVSQGGLRENWGKNWQPIVAGSLYDARREGIKRRRAKWPDCHRTLGEGEPMEAAWPEARGQ